MKLLLASRKVCVCFFDEEFGDPVRFIVDIGFPALSQPTMIIATKQKSCLIAVPDSSGITTWVPRSHKKRGHLKCTRPWDWMHMEVIDVLPLGTQETLSSMR